MTPTASAKINAESLNLTKPTSHSPSNITTTSKMRDPTTKYTPEMKMSPPSKRPSLKKMINGLQYLKMEFNTPK